MQVLQPNARHKIKIATPNSLYLLHALVQNMYTYSGSW